MAHARRILSLSAIGLDAPGLVSKITSRVYGLGGNILDVEENSRHGLFSIFLVIDFSGAGMPMDEVKRELRELEPETGLKVILGMTGQDRAAAPEPEHLFITVLGKDRPGIIAEVSTLLHRYLLNIESCRMIARGTFFSMEMVAGTDRMEEAASPREREAVLERAKDELRKLCGKLDQSVVIQEEATYRQAKKVVVFDVESCLIRPESARGFLEALNRVLEPRGGHIRTGGEAGGWAQTLADNAGALKGVPIAEIEAAARALELHGGALEVLRILKSMGYKVALLSTAFNCVLRWIYEAEPVDYAFCNTLLVDGSGLATGGLEEPALTPATKNEILEFIMNVEDISREQVVAVGDGSPRSRFIKDVGLSIACRTEEPAIRTDGVLSGDHMLNILYCLGITEDDIARHRGAGKRA